jgi:hypothetical protein
MPSSIIAIFISPPKFKPSAFKNIQASGAFISTFAVPV